MSEIEYPSFSRRLAGVVIDWGLAYLISFAFFSLNGFAIIGIFALFQILLICTLGRSFGHIVIKARVINESGGLPAPLQVIIRTALLCLVVPALIWDENGIPMHDKFAKTFLIRL